MESLNSPSPEGPILYQFFEIEHPIKAYVVLDRDSTLVVDTGYTFNVSDFAWMPGAVGFLETLDKLSITAFIATNQSGVGRGHFTIEQMELFNENLVQRAFWDAGLKIVAVAVCPHKPDLWVKCLCRKPEIGMLEALEREFGLRTAHGCLVGNSPTDVSAAERFGIPAIQVHDNGVSLAEALEQVKKHVCFA